MQGNYQNPHAIQPGEELSRQLLSDRFIEFSAYAETIEAPSRSTSCNKTLFRAEICCHDHMTYRAELDTFVRLLQANEMLPAGKIYTVTFSMIARWIKNYSLEYDVEKVAKATLTNVEACRKFFGN